MSWTRHCLLPTRDMKPTWDPHSGETSSSGFGLSVFPQGFLPAGGAAQRQEGSGAGSGLEGRNGHQAPPWSCGSTSGLWSRGKGLPPAKQLTRGQKAPPAGPHLLQAFPEAIGRWGPNHSPAIPLPTSWPQIIPHPLREDCGLLPNYTK